MHSSIDEGSSRVQRLEIVWVSQLPTTVNCMLQIISRMFHRLKALGKAS